MTIRIIDLLDKIANGEKIPTKVKYLGEEFNFIQGQFLNKKREELWSVLNFLFFQDVLNATIEILPEEKDDTYCMTD